jgi:uncharacterized protein (DUF1330 family)
MKTYYTVALSVLAGVGLGALAVQGIHAQAKPPIYQFSEIEVLDQANYLKDYGQKAQALIKASGGKYLALGGKTTSYDGEPPKPRISLVVWDNADQFQAYRNSTALKELLPIRDKLSKFRTFSVEGLPQ